jgi:hypothetical protein
MPLITRNLSFHARGNAVFAHKSAMTWGGVIMQAEASFRSEEGIAIKPSNITLSLESGKDDGFWLKHAEEKGWIEFDHEKLLPLLRWIETGATGAYTAYEIDEEVIKDAGLTTSENGNYLPIEFRATPLEDLLFDADFTDAWDTNADTQNLVKKHQKLAQGSERTKEGDWFVSDVDSQITATFSDGEINLTGYPYKYDFDYTDGEFVYVKQVSALVDPEKIDELNLKNLFNVVDTSVEEEIVEIVGEIKGELDKLRAEAFEAKKIAKVFQVVAVLRAIKEDNPKAWSSFLDSVASSKKEDLDIRLKLEATWLEK